MIDQYLQKHGRRIYGLCITLCKNTFDADDLYQECWLKAYQKLYQYDGLRPFEVWMSKICVNTYCDMLRKSKVSHIFDGFHSNEEKDQALANIQQREKEDYSDLHAAIDKLPKKMRMTVILHYFHDLDEKTTADVLGIPIGTVKSRLHQAKKRLRKELKNEPDLQF